MALDLGYSRVEDSIEADVVIGWVELEGFAQLGDMVVVGTHLRALGTATP